MGSFSAIFTPKIQRLLVRVMVISVFVSLVIYVFTRNLTEIARTDYRNFATGALMIARGEGKNLYNLPLQLKYQNQIFEGGAPVTKLLPFMNLPFYGLLFIPFIESPVVAYRFYSILIIASLGIILYVSPKVFPKIKRFTSWPLLVVLFLPNLFSVGFVQTTPYLTLALIAEYWLLKNKKWFWAGVVAGLFFLKIQFLIMVPFFLLLSKKRKDFVFGFASFTAFVLAADYLISGKDFLSQYITLIQFTDAPVFGNRPRLFNTLYYFLISSGVLGPNQKSLAFGINLSAYAASFILFLTKLSKINFDRLFASAILLGIVFGIHVLPSDLTLTLPVIFILLNQISANQKNYNLINIVIVTTLFVLPFISLLNAAFLAAPVLLVIAMYLIFIPNQNEQTNFQVAN